MKRIQIRQALIALAGGAVNVLSNVLATLIASTNWKFLIIILSALIVVAVVYWIVRPQKVTVHIETNPLRTPEERKAKARRGLIVCAGLYSPLPGSAARDLTPEQQLEYAKSEDYRQLDFPNSNLAILIEAVTSHSPTLEHCWILTTTAADGRGKSSAPFVPAVIRYLREQREVTCQFHVDGWAIPLDDDAAVTVKVRDMVNRIFVEAKKLGLEEEQLIADITSGMRSIPFGIILACLDKQRDIQYMGTRYGDNAKPEGPLFPVLYDFNVDLLE